MNLPTFSPARFALLTAMSLVAMSLLNLAVFGDVPWEKLPPEYNGLRALQMAWVAGLAVVGTISLVRALRPLGKLRLPTDMIWMPAVSIIGGLGLLGLLLKRTRQFNTWGYEDQIAENLSFGFLLMASLLFALFVYQSRKKTVLIVRVIAVMGVIGCFILAMEEISWFQRILDIETSELLSGNAQGETNLHNFATAQLETLLFAASTLLLLGGSVLRSLNYFPNLKPILPPWYLGMSMAPMTALTYVNWNQPLIQASLMLGVVLLLVVIILADGRLERLLSSSLLIVTVLILASVLTKGERFFRSSAANEWRELYVAGGLVLYAGYVLCAIRTEQSAVPCNRLVNGGYPEN